LLALACARAPRLELMERFAELAHSTLQTEMDLHRAYAADWGISREELERERPHAATRAYGDFLLRTAALADFGELVAALLPCMWGYSELGQRLAQDRRPTEERYARWIEMYSGEEFANLARWCREVCDEAANSAGEEGKGGCERRSWQAVATSSSSGSKPGATRLEVHRSPRSRRWRPSLARPASFPAAARPQPRIPSLPTRRVWNASTMLGSPESPLRPASRMAVWRAPV
jgi:hypothetical protein